MWIEKKKGKENKPLHSVSMATVHKIKNQKKNVKETKKVK
jgi:hypothetical protein